MAVLEGRGNLLKADVEALVNTVNTVGVMGKGVALQFKKAFPENFRAYKAACDRSEVRLGQVFIYSTGRLDRRPAYIINFPTKEHWRSKARLSDIESGLEHLVKEVERLGIESIAIPPLGCGLGGLDWDDVRPHILEALAPLGGLTAYLYPPVQTPTAADMPVASDPPDLTRVRTALLALLDKYTGSAGRGATPIEVHKLAYLLERVGEPLDLRFAKGRYGPYSSRLEHALERLEGHYIVGVGDRSKAIQSAEPIVMHGDHGGEVAKAAQEFGVLGNVDRVMALVDGFSSSYGTELLATVDWAAHESDGADDVQVLVSAIHEWSRRKARLFSPSHVGAAVDRLREFDLIDD
ncbi:MAG: macro domain-containing protein [Acidimicrobiia bacterium]